MTFGAFARNYLNPIVLALRAGPLYVGAACMMIAFISDSPLIVKIPFGIFGGWLLWIGIKPWGTGRGLSISQINDMAKRANDR
ncbi:MAG: hypothetical protein KGZ83_10985 [Sulfuricella sp.]|nr:hypothetical protein [Sulfuricella sp.]